MRFFALWPCTHTRCVWVRPSHQALHPKPYTSGQRVVVVVVVVVVVAVVVVIVVVVVLAIFHTVHVRMHTHGAYNVCGPRHTTIWLKQLQQQRGNTMTARAESEQELGEWRRLEHAVESKRT